MIAGSRDGQVMIGVRDSMIAAQEATLPGFPGS
jgi:hypothetical protein